MSALPHIAESYKPDQHETVALLDWKDEVRWIGSGG